MGIVLQLLAVTIIAGGTPALIKLAALEIPPFSFTFLRMAIASLGLLPFFLKFQNRPVTSKRWGALLTVCLGNIVNIIFFVFGVVHVSPFIAQSMYLLLPSMVWVMALILGRSAAQPRVFGGLLLSTAGALLLIFSDGLLSWSEVPGGESNLAGILLVLLAVMGNAFYTYFSKPLSNEFSPFEITFVMSLAVGAFSLPLACWEILSALVIPLPSLESVLALIYVGLIGTVGIYLFVQIVVAKKSPLIASLLFYLMPAGAGVWTYLVFDEPPTILAIIGAILTVIGSLIIERYERNGKTELQVENI